jgi:starch synthase
LPIAHATGGLADTIDDGTTGFLFSTLTAGGLMEACHRAFDAYQDEDQLGEMRRAAMARSFGWAAAAAEYEALYRRLLGLPPARIEPIPRTTHETVAPMTEALEPAA